MLTSLKIVFFIFGNVIFFNFGGGAGPPRPFFMYALDLYMYNDRFQSRKR